MASVWIVLVICVTGLFLVGWITWVGDHAQAHTADCIIVPGAAVDSQGRPGRMLAARIDNAIRLYREGWASAIIFTGGVGESGPIESEAARRVAIRLGVPAEHLFSETESHSTYENFLHARAIMRAHEWRSCLVSTDPFHVLRCLIIARALGMEAWGAPAFDSPGYTQFDVRFGYTLRECAGMARFLWQRLAG